MNFTAQLLYINYTMRLFLILCILVSTFGANAQKTNPKNLPSPPPVDDIFNSTFVPRTITYNASDKSGECWEAVAHGIEVDMGNGKKGFFQMQQEAIEELKNRIGDKVVVIYVDFYNKIIDKSGALGVVEKIEETFDGKLLYDRRSGNYNSGTKE